MTYNIEIFKSKSYQKILKAVLKFRYSDLNYKEALIEESKKYVLGRPITICEFVDCVNDEIILKYFG